MALFFNGIDMAFALQNSKSSKTFVNVLERGPLRTLLKKSNSRRSCSASKYTSQHLKSSNLRHACFVSAKFMWNECGLIYGEAVFQ